MTVEAFATSQTGIDSILDQVGRIIDQSTLVRNTRYCSLVLADSSRVVGTLSCCIDVRIDRHRSLVFVDSSRIGNVLCCCFDYRTVCIDLCCRRTRKSCCYGTRIFDTCHDVDCDRCVDVPAGARSLVVVVVLNVVFETRACLVSMFVLVVRNLC